MSAHITRRAFLKGTSLGLGALVLQRGLNWRDAQTLPAQQWTEGQKMGRVCQGKVDIRLKPFSDSKSVKAIYDDAIVQWLREVVSEAPGGYGSARWVETPDGYI